MNRKIILMLSTILCILTGCGSNSQKSAYYVEPIVTMTNSIVECIDSKDESKLAELYYSNITEDTYEKLNEFLNNYSTSESVLVDCGSYLKESEAIDNIKYDKYSGVSAIVKTQDNTYRLLYKFRYNKKYNEYYLIQLVAITGESEAYENLDFYNKDYTDSTEDFLYVNYHDNDFYNLTEYKSYETIFGDIIASRNKSTELTLEDAESLISKGLTEEQLFEILGEPRASIKKTLTYDYYTNKNNQTFIMFKIDIDGNVESCKEVSDKYTGYISLK
jgi:hypothetical protein